MENIFLIILLFTLSFLMFGFVFRNKNASQFRFGTILYALVFSLFIGVGGLLGNKSLISVSSVTLYYLLIGWMLALGIIHAVLLKRILLWTSEKNMGAELLLTLGIGFLGSALLLITFHYSGSKAFLMINLSSVLMFIVPGLFFITYLFFLDIPVKVLRKWQYPVDKHIDDPTDREMDAPLVVGFEFKKKPDDENMTTFRAKAPKEMTFGKLFYYFINDYNTRNPDEKIEYLDDKNKPVSWIFYIKPKWFSGIRYIDPQETNSFNFIKENSVIVCKRVTEK